MAGVINEARTKISKMFNGEPRSYTRFNLAHNMDGDNSHVEVNLSGKGDEEEVDETEAQRTQAASTYTHRPTRPYKNMCYGLLLVLTIFLSGYLIGYLTQRKPEASKQPVECFSVTSEVSKDEGGVVHPLEPSLAWNDITSMLRDRLLPVNFNEKLSFFAMNNHMAGSPEDEILANKVLQIFKSLEMTPWTDEHYVQLQVPSSDSPNKVLFGSEEIGKPKGYLAYSATGTKTGRVVYANYGQEEDLEHLENAGVNVAGSVVLVRTGQISLAEKVSNAAQKGAAAVLIYREPTFPVEDTNTELYGHVHMGTGDPYTPGFPSFNHTQFPPAKSSGLPNILAQTITANMAVKILSQMAGKDAPNNFQGSLNGVKAYKLGGEKDLVTVTVNNILADTRIHNIFGVIKGFTDPDRYVVIGAQRDSFDEGYAKSTVGTTLLVELARAITEMKKAGFKPRRSIVFASWSAGDYGSVGATEWLEGYLPSLDKKAFTYISLDGVISGANNFKASASPLLNSLLMETLNEVKTLAQKDNVLFQKFVSDQSVLEPMKMEDSAYPFLTSSGIPSISFRFVPDNPMPKTSSDYKYSGTNLDNKDNLELATGQQLAKLCVSAAQVAGQMALRLVHDHILRLDVTAYTNLIRRNVGLISNNVNRLKSVMSTPVTSQWLMRASGSYSRAAESLKKDIQNSDLEDKEMCRNINDRIMRVEHNLLSPYVSPRNVPFRHIIFGKGTYTVSALSEHLKNLRVQTNGSDADLLLNQFALTTWTIQSCANNLAGDVWALDNELE